MGMDVYGIGNKKAYFRANIWSWKPIHNLIERFASDLVDQETIAGMATNSGYGITDKSKCLTLANRIASWMEHNVNGLEVDRTDEETESIEKVLEAISTIFTGCSDQISFGENKFPKYEVDDKHLNEFVEFLRICDGFKVL